MKQEVSTAASMGAKGGKARALSLTPDQRRESAKKAIQARWEKGKKVVTAPLSGEIVIGDLRIPCAVLEDGIRVLSERGVMSALGVARSGFAHNRVKEEAEEGGAALPLFLAPAILKPFIDLELASVLSEPIWYRPESGPVTGVLHKGLRAELLPKVCNVWLNARDAGVVKARRQIIVVANADIIVRGLSEVGITALVDEATGFQDMRARDALAKILEQFVAKELQSFVRLFPLSYYKNLCRLRRVAFSPNLQLPRYFGHLTNNIIYSRLAPAVLEELRRKNPVVNGRRKNKHYNWLTAEMGHPKLLQHLGSVNTLMELAEDDWEAFMKMLDKIHPVYEPFPLFDNLPDLEPVTPLPIAPELPSLPPGSAASP